MPVHPRIEVFGLCGAGKSTIVARLLPLLAARGSTLSATRPVPPWGPHSLTRTARLLAAALVRKPLPLAPFLTTPSNWWLPLKLGYRSTALAKLPPGQSHILLDSGILQPFVSFAIEWSARPHQDIPLQALLPALPKAHAAIHIHAPAQDAMQRYLSRAQASGIAPPDRDWPNHFAAGAAITQAIAKACHQRHCPVIRIDNEQEPTGAALTAAVEALLDHLSATKSGQS